MAQEFAFDRPTAHVVTITPEKAQAMLDSSVYNRPIQLPEVQRLAASMLRGEWKLGADHIAFNTRGELINGHHRLRAIVAVKMTLPMMVTYGLQPEAYEVIDIGRRRSYSDRLRLPRDIAEVLRFACSILLNTQTPTLEQMRPVTQAGLQETTQRLVDYCPARVRVFSSASIKLAAVISIMRDKQSQYVMEQYKALCHQEYDQMTPIAQSFSRQVAMSAGARNNKWDYRDLLARGCKVFDKSRAGQTRLQITDGEWETCRVMVRDVLLHSMDKHWTSRT